jgi:hypothetical protein
LPPQHSSFVLGESWKFMKQTYGFLTIPAIPRRVSRLSHFPELGTFLGMTLVRSAAVLGNPGVRLRLAKKELARVRTNQLCGVVNRGRHFSG